MTNFVILKTGDKLCPNCGSLPRTRRLFSMLENQVTDKKILHFSPSKSLSNRLSKISSVTYESSDYMGEFVADKNYNIEAINIGDNSYDVIICYHILEHIQQDVKAMEELYRVLKPEGMCYIQTPFKMGEIYEDDTILTPAARLKYFGQEDHLRIYSVEGLTLRLRKAGFKVEVRSFTEDDNHFNGFNPSETVIVAVKET
ncbi:class I SAM-dependent methyltransferase [Formosa algae]|uniref:SAM-dependent methyltransferase n=1 Tax=Formosa algae TaxID=225843 RepID=A0A9X1CAN6_9FLAO|nr:class I SAM-dependent methyltransferase [Formosa algae]MBP1838370.1 SAM-dependent methyltransferase [Formosa algae]MDQ0334505.1 SAM-dependent methyltransferase [Formosa algae]